jgi:hypothetical protein
VNNFKIMDWVARFPLSPLGQVKITSFSMLASRIGFSEGLNGLLKVFYNSNTKKSRFFNLYRLPPLSILTPFQRPKAVRGG